MAKNTIEKLEAARAKSTANREKWNESITELKLLMEHSQKGIADALAAENMDEYNRLFSIMNDARIKIDGYNELLSRPDTSVAEADILDGWADYAAAYNKKIDAHIAQYEKARRELLEKYIELVREQNEAYSIRERYAALRTERPGRHDGFAVVHTIPVIRHLSEYEGALNSIGIDVSAVSIITKAERSFKL